MDLEHFHLNNGQNFVLRSSVPLKMDRQEVIMGIDEAGKRIIELRQCLWYCTKHLEVT